MTPEAIGIGWLLLCVVLLVALGTRAWARRPPGTRLLARMRRAEASIPADTYPWNISFLVGVALMCGLAVSGGTTAQNLAASRTISGILWNGFGMLIELAVLCYGLVLLWRLGSRREQSS